MTLRVLILGGYGVFGGRLARLLSVEPGLTLLIAGRSLSKAQALCDTLPKGAGREARAIDRDGDIAAAIQRDAPDLVVDASGPFQAYGAAPYRVIEACLAQGVDYMDLADGADFVAGVGAHDAAARAAGVSVLSGLSTCPALTAAVVRSLSRDMEAVSAITAGIAPSPYTVFGMSVVRALLSYAGKPASGGGRCLTETRHRVVAPPGRIPLRRRLFALVETPDAVILPQLWPQARVWFSLGVSQGVLLQMLMALAWLVRVGLARSLAPLAPLCRWAINTLRWGEHRGGMFVAVDGLSKGRPITRTWHLVAEGDEGPYVPTVAVTALVRRRLAGQRPAPGARHAARDVELADYAPIFAERGIVTGVREEPAAGSAFRRVIGAAFDDLPAPVKVLHEGSADAVYEGRAVVARGRGPLAALIAAVVGFPKAGDDVPLRVEITCRHGVETWRRIFAGKPFHSVLGEGKGAWAHLAEERFGPVSFGIALALEGGQLSYVIRGWKLLGLPMPGWLTPRGETYETAGDGRFAFNVEIVLPIVGLLVRYRGWLSPA